MARFNLATFATCVDTRHFASRSVERSHGAKVVHEGGSNLGISKLLLQSRSSTKAPIAFKFELFVNLALKFGWPGRARWN